MKAVGGGGGGGETSEHMWRGWGCSVSFLAPCTNALLAHSAFADTFSRMGYMFPCF
jgi:hypothetical protein